MDVLPLNYVTIEEHSGGWSIELNEWAIYGTPYWEGEPSLIFEFYKDGELFEDLGINIALDNPFKLTYVDIVNREIKSKIDKLK